MVLFCLSLARSGGLALLLVRRSLCVVPVSCGVVFCWRALLYGVWCGVVACCVVAYYCAIAVGLHRAVCCVVSCSAPCPPGTQKYHLKEICNILNPVLPATKVSLTSRPCKRAVAKSLPLFPRAVRLNCSIRRSTCKTKRVWREITSLLTAFSVFTCRSRSVFLSVYATANDQQHSLIILSLVWCLRHCLFTYLSYENFALRIYVFHRELFGLSIFLW